MLTQRQWPTLSVVLPCYNNTTTLAACLQSFATQIGAQALEIIVVDDGAEPTAAAIAASIATEIPIDVIHSHRAGQSAATNLGIARCKGDLVVLTCADMVATPYLLQSYLRAYQAQDKEVGVLGHITYAPWLDMTPFMVFLETSGIQFDFAGLRTQNPPQGQMLYAPNCMVPRNALMRVGMFDPDFPYGFQDCDLGIRLEQSGLPFVYCEKALAWHDHPNTIRHFAHRHVEVHKHWARMAERYPQRIQPGLLIPFIQRYAHRAHEIEACIGLAERAERQKGIASCAQMQASLTALFHTICAMAMVKGILHDSARLGEVLPIILPPHGVRPAAQNIVS
jgi:GT2 family glycosyltransferase